MVHVLNALKAQIISGELSPGEQVRQEEMAEKLQVSRVPLREAMNVLADQGLLFHRPNQGYFVTKHAPAEHAQIRRMLYLLEHELALSRAWPNDRVLAALNDLNFQIKTCVARADVPGLIKLNREFHFLVLSLSPNGLIFEEVRRLWSMIEPLLRSKFDQPGERERTVVEHDRMIPALVNADQARYMAEMERHR